jgi:trimethylamine--corrinoid protein Co-methyltransferase
VDSKEPDAQAAHEFTLTAMLPALAGANLIYGLGMLDSGMTWDYAQAVMHNEMLRMVQRVVKGIEISDEKFAFDVIQDVGPGGEFITHDHTLTHMRQQSQGDLFDRSARDAWVAAGSKSIVEGAYDRAAQIVATHQAPPLPDKIQSELDAIFDEAEAQTKERKQKEKKSCSK